MAVLFKVENEGKQKSQIGRDECSVCYSVNMHAKSIDKHHIQHNIEQVVCNCYDHRISSILHTQEPSVYTVECKNGRCRVNPDVEIDTCVFTHICSRLDQPEAHKRNRVL